MDFVVAGLGIGALMVVIGFAVRDIGPLFRRRTDALDADSLVERRRRLALCYGISTALTLGGSVILIATLAAVLLGASDSAGTLIVLASTLIGVAIAVGASLKTARELRDGHAPAEPAADPPTRGARHERRAISSDGRQVPTVRQVPKAHREQPIVAEFAPFEQPSDLEPFDATRLLPEEVDEDSESVPKPADEPIRPIADPVEPTAVETDMPEEVSEAAPERAETVSDAAPGDARAGSQAVPGTFRSPLLADIDETEPAPYTNGQFASHLLADVSSDEAAPETFHSPLLADVDAELAEPDRGDDAGDPDDVDAVGRSADPDESPDDSAHSRPAVSRASEDR